MGILGAIISAMAIVIGAIISSNAQERANEQNIAAATNNQIEQEEFAKESAEEANRDTENMYNNLYSPAAVINQQRNAGLSISYLYGKGGGGSGGTSAAQAAQPTQQAPYINPILAMSSIGELAGVPNQLMNAKKTSKETKEIDANIENIKANTEKAKAEIPEINQRIEQSKKEIEEIESRINLNVVTQTQKKLENQILELDRKYQESTLKDRAEILKQQLNLMDYQEQELEERIRGEKIENDNKKKLINANLALMEAQREKLIAEKVLAYAQEVTEAAKQKLMDEQGKLTKTQRDEIEHKIKEIDQNTEKLRNETESKRIENSANKWSYGMHHTNGFIGVLLGTLKDFSTALFGGY